MALVIHGLGNYPKFVPGVPWQQDHYNVNKLVKALKGDTVKGFAEFLCADGVRRRFDEATKAVALDIFAVWATHRLLQITNGAVTLIPVPSSSQTAFDQDAAPGRMGTATAARNPARLKLAKVLRFTEPLLSARKGGSRNRAFLKDKLAFRGGTFTRPVVLVDDVKTTGNHLLACADVLREAGATVQLGIVAAFATQDPMPNPLSVDPEDLEDLSDFENLNS